MTRRPSVWQDFKRLSHAERSLWHFPMMWLAAVAIVFTPLLYATIYLGSSLDPYNRLQYLPVGLVNLDKGTVFKDKQRNLGHEVIDRLQRDAKFHYIRYPTEADAQSAVRRGETYFSLTIPGEFSQKALAGSSSEHGLLRFYISEGSNYFASRVASSFSTTLSTELNQSLSENRWDAVQVAFKKTQKGFTDLRHATGQLRNGAQELEKGAGQVQTGAGKLRSGVQQAAAGSDKLSSGAKQLSGSVKQLTTGTAQLSTGLRKLEAAAPGQTQLAPLQRGAGQLVTGTQRLDDGLGQLAAGADKLSNGAKSVNSAAQQLAAGNKQLAQQLPQLQNGLQQASSGSKSLTAGAAKLAAGATQLAEMTQNQPALPAPLSAAAAQLQGGATQVHAASSELAGGLAQLTSGAGKAATGAQALSQGAGQLAQGTAQLQTGAATLASSTHTAQQGSEQLRSGAKSLQSGVNTLVKGNLSIKAALKTATQALPSTSQLNQLSSGASTLAQRTGELNAGLKTLTSGSQQLETGSAQVHSGAQKLRRGLDTLYDRIPANLETLDGDPQGLSASVLPVVKKYAPVSNNGTAFAPYFIALSLWVGCTLTTFIFPYQQLPQHGRNASQFAKILRKYTAPALLVTAQALLVVLGVHLLGVEYLHPVQVTLSAVASSLTFLALVLGLIMMFGSAGRLFALILLVLQLAASGGSYPIETAPSFFQTIHRWMPVTQSVKALRHGISGAYLGEYLTFMLVLVVIFLSATVLAWLGRRWEYTPNDRLLPLIVSPLAVPARTAAPERQTPPSSP